LPTFYNADSFLYAYHAKELLKGENLNNLYGSDYLLFFLGYFCL